MEQQEVRRRHQRAEHQVARRKYQQVRILRMMKRIIIIPVTKVMPEGTGHITEIHQKMLEPVTGHTLVYTLQFL